MKELGEDKLNDGTPKLALEAAPAPVAGQEPSPEVLESLKQRVNKKEIFGYLVAGPNIEAEGNFKLYVKNVGSIQVTSSIERALRRAVISLRAENMKLALDPASLKALLAPVDMDSFQVVAGEGKAKKSNFLVSYFGTFGFVMILFMSMLLYGIAVMRGILEEKSNRIMEVLLGSLTPNELMTGKILGIALVGLTQLAVYTLTAGALRIFMMTRTVSEDMAGMADIFSMSKMVYFVLFFLLGYFMYTGMFAAVGAVCNSEQEAQNLQAPVQYMLMIPMIVSGGTGDGPPNGIYVITGLVYVVYFVIFVYLASRVLNLTYNKTTLEGLGLRSTVRARDLMRLYAFNTFGIILSAGMLIPWAMIRMARYRASRLVLLADDDIDTLAAEGQGDVSAVGAEIDHVFDMDIGL